MNYSTPTMTYYSPAIRDYEKNPSVIPIVYNGNLVYEIWGDAATKLSSTALINHDKVTLTKDKWTQLPVMRWLVFFHDSVMRSLKSLGYVVKIYNEDSIRISDETLKYNAEMDNEDMNRSFAEFEAEMATADQEPDDPTDYADV